MTINASTENVSVGREFSGTSPDLSCLPIQEKNIFDRRTGTMCRIIFAGFLSLMIIQSAVSPVSADRFNIRVQGRDEAILTKATIVLSDIAQVTSPRIQDDEVILALNRIEIASAPQPGQSLSLSAHDIISKIQSAGVKISEIGYAFPRVVTVKRAARLLAEGEVQQSIEEYVRKEDPEATVRQVTFPKTTAITPDAKIVEVFPAAYSEGSSQKFILKIQGDGQSDIRVTVSAAVDRWAQVAVLRRSIQKGELVDAGDVMMARLNLQALPTDTISDTSKVIGLETKRNLAAGEVLQKNKLILPTVIKAGEKVTLKYRSSMLEATATGISLEDAGLQEQIRVKNEISKKVISGTVSAPGIVEVRQ